MRTPDQHRLAPAPEPLPTIDGTARRPVRDKVSSSRRTASCSSAIAATSGSSALFAVVLALVGGASASPRYDLHGLGNAPGRPGEPELARVPRLRPVGQLAGHRLQPLDRGGARSLATVERKLGLRSEPAVTPRLSAEPIPLAPAFRVDRHWTNRNPKRSGSPTPRPAPCSSRESKQQLQPAGKGAAGRLPQSLARAQAGRSATLRGGSRICRSDALAQAQARKATAQVKLKGVSAAYVAAVASQAPSQGLVSLIAGATSASSDRKAKIELYGFLGLLAGLIGGCGAAVLRRAAGSESAADLSHNRRGQGRDDEPSPLP